MSSDPVDAGLPAGWGLRLDRRTIRPRPDLLVGGFPTRVLRLSAAGARLVDEWAQGGPVTGTARARRLARILTDRGVAHPIPHKTGERVVHPVTAVVPVRDRAIGLAATLAGLSDELAVIVVDDASVDLAEVAGVVAAQARMGETTVLRHPRAKGPGAARNAGWRRADTELVAMVDADVEVAGSWLDDLTTHFDDPTVGAVAPRVVAVADRRTPGWLAAYEAARSPLDMGPRPAPVRPRSRVPYVPTTALVVRRQAMAEVGGFDEALATGEDVDLVWRLAAKGWRVRYDPRVTVGHPTRRGLGSWARQRVGYGRSAAPLHIRHGQAVAPLAVSAWSAAAAGAALAGHPGLAVAASGAGVTALVMRMDRRSPRGAIARVAVVVQAQALRATAEALRRVWWPLAALSAWAVPRTRPALAAAVIAPPVAAWVRQRPHLDPLRWSLLYLADDVAYGAGVWVGAVAGRHAGALRPAFIRPARTTAWSRSPGTPRQVPL